MSPHQYFSVGGARVICKPKNIERFLNLIQLKTFKNENERVKPRNISIVRRVEDTVEDEAGFSRMFSHHKHVIKTLIQS